MRWLHLVLASALLGVPVPQGSPVAAKLSAEMDRVRIELAAAPDSERVSPAARLDRARVALTAARPLLALYLMEMPWTAARSWTFVKASNRVTSADAFARKWAAVGEPRPVRPPAGAARRPALLDAFAAAADARGPITYQASRLYGEDAGLDGGLYYLGESQAEMQFAGFVRALGWTAAGAAPPLRSIAAEIAAFDVEMTTAYETMDRANHSTYIVASAALKQARTLEEQRQFGGALFEYLLSRYLFAPLRGPAARDATAESIAAARATLDASLDNSIAGLFLDLAGEGLVSDIAAQHRGAAAAVEDVIPAYLRAIAPPSLTTAAGPRAQVTITLVRWPFT